MITAFWIFGTMFVVLPLLTIALGIYSIATWGRNFP